MTSLDLQASVVKIGVNEQFYPDDTAFMITEFKLGLKFKCSNSGLVSLRVMAMSSNRLHTEVRRDLFGLLSIISADLSTQTSCQTFVQQCVRCCRSAARTLFGPARCWGGRGLR